MVGNILAGKVIGSSRRGTFHSVREFEQSI